MTGGGGQEGPGRAEETSSGPGWKRLKDLRFASLKERYANRT